MLFSKLQQDRTTLSPLHYFKQGPSVGLAPDLVGVHSISLAARYLVAA